MTHDEMIAILAAHRDGRRIQFKRSHHYEWMNWESSSPPFDWSTFIYRIKPGMVCKTRIQVRGGHCVYVEGGPEVAKILEDNGHYLGKATLAEGFPREEFELKPI